MKSPRIAVFLSCIFIFAACKGEKQARTALEKPTTCDQKSHLVFVQDYFQLGGSEIHHITLIGNNGNCGYQYVVNGFNPEEGLGFDCTVKTSTDKGIEMAGALSDRI